MIRYGVTPVDGVLNQLGLGLNLRYRDGSGRVVAVLIEVDIATGNEQPPIITFHSKMSVPSNAFQVKVQGLSNKKLDFTNNAYYVELMLTASSHPPMPILFPPKVSVIQLALGPV